MSFAATLSASSSKVPYAIHSLFRDKNELAIIYTENKGKYKALKEALIEDIEAFVAPMREVRDAITDGDVKNILKDGGERARAIASKKMEDVRQKIGITI